MRRARGAGRYSGAARRSDPPGAGVARDLARRKARRRVRRPRLCRDPGDDLADRFGRRGFRLDPARARLSHGAAAAAAAETGGGRKPRLAEATSRRSCDAEPQRRRPRRSMPRPERIPRPRRSSQATRQPSPVAAGAVAVALRPLTIADVIADAAPSASLLPEVAIAAAHRCPMRQRRAGGSVRSRAGEAVPSEAPQAQDRRSAMPRRDRPKQLGRAETLLNAGRTAAVEAAAAPKLSPHPRRCRARNGRGLAARRPLGRTPAASRSQPSSPSRSASRTPQAAAAGRAGEAGEGRQARAARPRAAPSSQRVPQTRRAMRRREARGRGVPMKRAGARRRARTSGTRPPRERFQGKGRDRRARADNGPAKFGGDRDKGGRDKGGRDKRDSGRDKRPTAGRRTGNMPPAPARASATVRSIPIRRSPNWRR